MECAELSKTSDEIINELFSSLNVPLSPKPVCVEERASKGDQVSAHVGDSDNSGDEESDSKSSESEEETKMTIDEVQEEIKTDKIEKLKSQKKKKDKKKKKKKHKKKEDGGRHKHKKKKKKESFETAEEAEVAAEVLQDDKVKNQAYIQKIIHEEFRQLDVRHSKTNEKCKSETFTSELHSNSKSPEVADIINCVGEKERSQKSHLNCKETVDDSPVFLHEKLSDSSSHPKIISECTSKEDNLLPSGKFEESASESVAECSSLQKKNPVPVSVSEPAQTGVTGSGIHKRKQSLHSRSPSPTCTKKIKSSNSSLSSKSSSPKTDSRQRSRSGSDRDNKSESASKAKRSRSRSRKSSKSKRSRSHSRKRSTSKSRKSGSARLRRSRSRSKKRSRSRSRSKSKKRSGSKSKLKSRSRSKNRSRSVSRKRSTSMSRKSFHSKSRKSRSKDRSKSRSRKRSKSNSRRESTSKSKRSRSRGRSKSISRKRSQSRSQSRRRSRSQMRRSRSRSAKRSRSKSRRSRSRRKSGSRSRRRSRSRSRHKSSPCKEKFDMFVVMRERANRLAELKSQSIPDGSLGSLLLSSVQSLSVPMPDPSSIPLPHKECISTEAAKDDVKEEGNAEVEEDKLAVPVVEDPVILSPHEQDPTKARDKAKQEEGSEKGKTKTIITIKSLKDSIVFQQAQEEAERKAKEKVDQPELSELQPELSENTCGSNSEHQQLHESSDEEQEEAKLSDGMSLTEKQMDSENIMKGRREGDMRRKEKHEKDEEKRIDGEKQRREAQAEAKADNTKKQCEKEVKESETSCKEEKEMKLEEKCKKKIVNKPEDNEDIKEDKLSNKSKEEKRKGSKHASKTEEKNKPASNLEADEETSSKKLSKSGERVGREIKLSNKQEEQDESKRNQFSKLEEKAKGIKHSNKTDETPMKTCSKPEESSKAEEKNKAEKEESQRNKISKLEEKEDEQMSKQSYYMEKTEESDENKVCSKDESGKNGHSHPEQDSTDSKVEEGEIVSDKEEAKAKSTSKSHSKKKSKKDKSSTKEKKKSHRDKSKNKDEKKKAREKKKEHAGASSRSKDRHRSKQQASSSSKDHHSRRHRRRSRSRSHSRSGSHSRDHSSRQHRRSHSRSRSKSRSKRRRESTSDLRDKVTRKRLLEIARRNAVYLMQNGCLPPSVEQEQLVKIKAGGKSVDELTDFCKQLVASGNYSDVDVSEQSISSEEENNSEKPFSSTRHPFSVRDSKPILMNIRNAPMLPTKTNAERLAGQAKLREQFPVSSGSQHRTKESEWVPVPPKEKKEEDKVFTKPEVPPVDISQIVSTRLSAMRKLQDNPNDSEAIKTLNNVQKEMQNWALSKQEPGQFTGTTGVKVLSQEELSSGHQAWARKEQFKEAAPVRPQFGLKMLQKMGWSPGEGLGKNKEGTTEPLLLDVKMDKKGFHAQEEVTPKKQPVPLVKDLSGKHPVSALVELCSKRKWSPPDFEMVFDCGPDHKKNFLMKVMVNGQEFKPSVAASTKKMAKANAAAAYLQSLGLYPKDPHYPL